LTDANPSVSLRAIEEKAEIEAAWAVLGDEDKRREYDMRLGSAKPGYPRTSLGYDEITGVPVRPLRPRNKTEVGSGEAIKNRVPRGRAWTTTETERPPGVVDGIARLDGAAKMEEVRETEEVNGEREDREGLEKTNEE
jgi:curved DNA-binding protein CbpA